MSEAYEPTSDFLKAVAANEVPLSGSEFGDENLYRLIAMMQDVDVSNKDWATMLVAQQDADTEEIRAALLIAVEDEAEIVRAEALLGIAQRDKVLALPFCLRALASGYVSVPVFEAATLIADPILCEALLSFTDASGDACFDQLVNDAMAACKMGIPASRIGAVS